MNRTNTFEDRHAAMHEALRRDAARIREPSFDAALHRAAMRRIREMENGGAARWMPRPAYAAALAALITCAGVLFLRSPRDGVCRPQLQEPDFSALLAAALAATADLDAPSPMPEWMSPTASLLEPLRLSPTNDRKTL